MGLEKPLEFWQWCFRGRTGKPGLSSLLDRWLAFHATTGMILAAIVPGTLTDAARTVLLPLSAVLIGISFAWVAGSQALIQSDEINRLAEHLNGGIETYVHGFQLSVLLILVVLVIWGLAGLGIFDQPCLWECTDATYYLAKAAIFAISSLALREIWHIVLGTQLLLLYQHAVSKLGDEHSTEDPGGSK